MKIPKRRYTNYHTKFRRFASILVQAPKCEVYEIIQLRFHWLSCRYYCDQQRQSWLAEEAQFRT